LNHTIYDIARVANVSKSTVSRVLNNQTNISKDAKDRVLKAIAELNYQPSKIARALSTGFDAVLVVSRSTKTTANNPFFSEIIHIIAAIAEEEDFDVIMQTSRNSKEELDKCITKINEKLIKGIIMLSSAANEDFYYQLDRYNIPIIVIGKVDGNFNNIFSVDTNNYQDSYNLTKHLIEHGHREIACLHPPLDYHVSVDRLEGYKKCLTDHGLPIREEWVIESGYTIETAYESAKRLLLAQDRPTAIFATDDLKVMSIYKAVSEFGMTIPSDVSVVGYSNSNIVPHLTPSLTRIEIPVEKLGDISTKLLFSKIKDNKNIVRQIVIPTEMKIQDSVASL